MKGMVPRGLKAPDGREPGDLRCVESHRDERACRFHSSQHPCARECAASRERVRASVTSGPEGGAPPAGEEEEAAAWRRLVFQAL